MNAPHRTGRALKLALPAAFALGLGGCATAPPPTAHMAVSQKALDDTDAADAPQYPRVALMRAREGLDAARVALNESHYEDSIGPNADATGRQMNRRVETIGSDETGRISAQPD
ncbi:MAG TPA: hypothetical protein VGR63_09150 [Casimicrobiaceae bacterium]|jgi:hypothetical protein|nr:hypothetical protein [Casimicrobiaceae bacterium]